jgi:hypothetical protein
MKTRIKFGTRKNGTKWYWPMDARKLRWEEIRDVNLILECYAKVQQLREQSSSSDQQDRKSD